MAEEDSLLDSPFTFECVDAEAVSFQTLQNDLEEVQVVMPRIAKASNVVDVYLDVLDEGKDAFHNLLCDVRRCGDAHGKVTVTVQAEWSGYSAKFFDFVVQFEGIVLHGYVKFGKELVTIAA